MQSSQANFHELVCWRPFCNSSPLAISTSIYDSASSLITFEIIIRHYFGCFCLGVCIIVVHLC